MDDHGLTEGVESVDNNALYTQPADILNIHSRLSKISPYFSIAAGFGNVHGVYVSPRDTASTLANSFGLETWQRKTPSRIAFYTSKVRRGEDWQFRSETCVPGISRRFWEQQTRSSYP